MGGGAHPNPGLLSLVFSRLHALLRHAQGPHPPPTFTAPHPTQSWAWPVSTNITVQPTMDSLLQIFFRRLPWAPPEIQLESNPAHHLPPCHSLTSGITETSIQKEPQGASCFQAGKRCAPEVPRTFCTRSGCLSASRLIITVTYTSQQHLAFCRILQTGLYKSTASLMTLGNWDIKWLGRIPVALSMWGLHPTLLFPSLQSQHVHRTPSTRWGRTGPSGHFPSPPPAPTQAAGTTAVTLVAVFRGGNVRSSLKLSSPYHFLWEIPLNSNRHLGTEASCDPKGFCTLELLRSLKIQSPIFPCLFAYSFRWEMEYTECAGHPSCNWVLATSFPTALKVGRFLILSLQITPLCWN